MSEKRRTQAERREQTRKEVLDSACKLFGQKGYADTSLEDIANDCNLTTRPVYHYFGNKKALFAAANEAMEARILEVLGKADPRDTVASWKGFMDLCDDPGFRQIVLIDSPNVLGRQRWWSGSPVTAKARESLRGKNTDTSNKPQLHQELFARMMIGAFAEAAMVIAEADDVELAKKEATRLVAKLFT